MLKRLILQLSLEKKHSNAHEAAFQPIATKGKSQFEQKPLHLYKP
jgi:hypothetical protein